MSSLQEELDRLGKFADPTPEDLGLPSDTHELWRLEYSCGAPRAAWKAYYTAVGHFHDEANARQSAREARNKAGGPQRRFSRNALRG